MKALTLWRPWDTAILRLGKPVENRDWPPPPGLVGQRFALHSGKKWDKDGAEFIGRTAKVDFGVLAVALHRALTIDSAVIGTVRLTRVISGAGDALSTSPWFFGAYGWVCEDPIAFAEPVPCRGAQGLWNLPHDIEARVLEQERRSSPLGHAYVQHERWINDACDAKLEQDGQIRHCGRRRAEHEVAT